MIDLERIPNGLIEIDSRMRIVRHGLHFGALCARKVALILYYLKGGCGAQLKFLLIGLQRLLRKDSRLNRRVIPGTGLPETDDRVLHVHPDL